ncbi:DUF7527 domain-containing protein [Halorubrum aethiopicum]|uniref:DUF7527 domain-containing protein n=1 Tax=Halorubrum aethiopicum TaxID=1758255 RepID=UPI00082F5A85|nr:hypothetical protein [Halorubrum aethiopicum]
MDAQRREDITGWNAREFDDGFDGLRRFADRGFSGAATDGTGWLFMLDGRVVGTVDADLDAFADASGTAYEAPHEALPVLFAMQERGGEQRARYYTKDTPLSEADRKLSQGGFTGYVELSENVLSGDYYVTYTAGESMAAAFVGNARRLETGEDAFDLANDEVGIYTVYEVDLDVREIPEPDRGSDEDADAAGDDRSDEPEPGAGAVAGVGADAGADGDADIDAGDDREENADEADDPADRGVAAGGTDADGTDAGETDAGPHQDSRRRDDTPDHGPRDEGVADADRQGASETESAAAGTEDPERPGSNGSTAAEPDDPSTETDGSRETERNREPDRDRSDVGDDGEDPSAPPSNATESDDRDDRSRSTARPENAAADRNATAADRNATRAGTGRRSEASTDRRAEASAASADPSDDDVFSEEAQWRETKSIPALDPSETSERGENPSAGSASGTNRRTGGPSSRPDGSAGASGQSRDDGTASEGSTAGRGSAEGSSPSPRSTERSGSGRTAVSGRAPSEVRERIEELESALSTAESAREEVAAERDELEAERDRLEEELERLRSEAERLREQLDRAESRLPEGERSLSAAEAREGTNLFVRYDSKGGTTLEDAHDGAVNREELRENLRIEHHTSFETEGLLVDGEPFESFLRGTMEYGFTQWLVEELPFEVGETGNGSALRDLYDALPEIDRAEIGGSVSVVIRENGEEVREQRSFDLVLRDRMGNPLFVAELNDSRAPTAGATLESLVANGGVIAESNEAFAGAFAVTASFFEPDALEAASDAVGGGLFNRSKRKSFVKLSRKRGYHLCLVESRDGGFHLTVPDL